MVCKLIANSKLRIRRECYNHTSEYCLGDADLV